MTFEKADIIDRLYLGIDKLPAHSALSDAIINRDSEVFGQLYHRLYVYYKLFIGQLHQDVRGGRD